MIDSILIFIAGGFFFVFSVAVVIAATGWGDEKKERDKIRNQSRKEKTQTLVDWWYTHICEDGMDGTAFDCDFLDGIKEWRDKYSEPENQ